MSNKTSEVGDESVDPFEPLLYNLFLANSNRMDQARMADILGVELQQLLIATSIAIRLGFATRLSIGTDEYGENLGGLLIPCHVPSLGVVWFHDFICAFCVPAWCRLHKVCVLFVLRHRCRLQQLMLTASIAIRLGFATKLSMGTDEYGENLECSFDLFLCSDLRVLCAYIVE